MTKVHMLRALVKQRLSATAEEIFGLFERTIAEYEEQLCRSQQENMRQRKLLDAVYNPQLQLHRADIQQLLVGKEVVSSEQQEWSSSLDQEAPHIKEEQEELWISQEGERIQGLQEAEVTRFPLTAVPVKSEDEEENPQHSQLHQRQTEQMETEAAGEDYGGPEAANNSDSDRDIQSDTDDETSHWSTPSSPDSESDADLNNCKKPLSCPECGKTFRMKANLTSHMRSHKGEKPFSCSVCKKSFALNGCLQKHMRIHTGEKPYTCGVCGKSFTGSGNLQIHMRIHTGEKPFSCSVCQKSFSMSGTLRIHMRIHTGEKPYGCSFCRKTFAQSSCLQQHVRIHTGEKPFTCSVCKKSFTLNGNLKKHMRIHTEEKPFSCSVCEKSFSVVGNLYKHMRIHTGEKPFTQDKTGDFSEPEPEDSDDERAGHLSSQIHETQTEKNSEVEPPGRSSAELTKTETDGEYYEGAEPTWKSNPDRHSESDSDFKPRDSSEPETEDSDDYWRETKHPHSGLNPVKNDKVSDLRCGAGEKPFICSECGKRYCSKGNLSRHMRIHTGEKRFICSYCDQRFTRLLELRRHRCVTPPARRHQTETKGNKEADPPASHSTEEMETKTDKEDCVGPEPTRTLDPDRHPELNTNDKLKDSSEPQTEDRDDEDDGKETRNPQSGLNSLEKSFT